MVFTAKKCEFRPRSVNFIFFFMIFRFFCMTATSFSCHIGITQPFQAILAIFHHTIVQTTWHTLLLVTNSVNVTANLFFGLTLSTTITFCTNEWRAEIFNATATVKFDAKINFGCDRLMVCSNSPKFQFEKCY